MARAVLASIRPIDAVLAAFKTGEGVPYADYGEDLHEGQAAFTRPLFENLLGRSGCRRSRSSTNGSSPIARARSGHRLRQGRSSIEIGRAYPTVQVDGIDSDTRRSNVPVRTS